MTPKFYFLAIGELKPDFLSSRIQKYLTEKHGVPVDWSHCALLVEGFEGHRAKFNGVWDHTGRGFDYCSLEDALDRGGAVIRHQIELQLVDEHSPYEALGWVRGKRGSWYANLQYALYILPPKWAHVIGKFLPRPIRKVFANGRALGVCSETLGYFVLDLAKGAEENAAFIDGDRLDPYVAVIECYKYGSKPAEVEHRA